MRPRYEPPSASTLAWVQRQLDPAARVHVVERLTGGITAHMDRITVQVPRGHRDVVLRRWPDEDDVRQLIIREAAALTALRGQPVPAPDLIAADVDGLDAGVPCTLTSALPGQPELAPADPQRWVEQLASAQAAVHAVPVDARTAPQLRPVEPTSDRYGLRDRPLDWLPDRGLRAAAREAAAGPLSDDTVFAHGDYQPFNVLWHAGRLTGVVDWPNAVLGNRGSDVGHCRLNLAVLFDAATADTYLQAYERAAGHHVDRRAELRALLCFDLDWQHFIPIQVAGRAHVDVPDMPDRVAATVRHALDRLG